MLKEHVVSTHIAQRGIGMVEVLVAVLILAIGVLGFSVLQVRAIAATSEAITRSQAMLIIRALAEEIRVNVAGQADYTTPISGFNVSTMPSAPSPSCEASACSPQQFANWDAYQAALAAYNQGIQLNMVTCPGAVGTNPRQCLIAGWGKTTPTIGTGAADCISSTGTYNATATCVMAEAYQL